MPSGERAFDLAIDCFRLIAGWVKLKTSICNTRFIRLTEGNIIT